MTAPAGHPLGGPADHPGLTALADQVQAVIDASDVQVAGFIILANHPVHDNAVSEQRIRVTRLEWRAALALIVRRMKV